MHGPRRLRLPVLGAVALLAACGADASPRSCFEADGVSRPASLPRTDAHWSGANADLAEAAACADAAGIRRAVAKGADVNAIGAWELPMILWPVLAESPEGFRLLLDAGADPGVRIDRAKTASSGGGERPLSRDSLALGLLAEGADPAFLDIALDHGLDPDSIVGNGEPLVWRAALSGEWAAVQRLIEAGADVDANDTPDGPRYTLLAHYATGAFDKVLWLMDRGARVDWPIERRRADGSAYTAYPILEDIFYYDVDAEAFPDLAAAQGEAQRRVLSAGHQRPPKPRRYAD